MKTNNKPEKDKSKLLDSLVLMSTFFVAILNKWYLMVNLKCTLWETLEAVVTSYRCSNHAKALKYKISFRKVSKTIFFIVRLSKLALDRNKRDKDIFKDYNA